MKLMRLTKKKESNCAFDNGFEIGFHQGIQESIVRLLEIRFPQKSIKIGLAKGTIFRIYDDETLERLLVLINTIQSIDEFEIALNQEIEGITLFNKHRGMDREPMTWTEEKKYREGMQEVINELLDIRFPGDFLKKQPIRDTIFTTCDKQNLEEVLRLTTVAQSLDELKEILCPEPIEETSAA